MTARYVAGSLALLALGSACGRTGLGTSPASDGAVSSNGKDGSPTGEVSAPSQLPVNGQCPGGFSACGKGDGLRCQDLSRSIDHCGACGQACAPGIACQMGVCQQYRCQGALSFKSLGTADGEAGFLGDFDGDGILDLVGSVEAGGPMTLLYGAGDGTFPSQHVIDSAPVPGWQGWQARGADLDGDGHGDLVSIGSDHATVAVRLGSGQRDAPFGEPTAYPATSTSLSGLLLADLDGDGRLDLVSGCSQGLEYWRGRDGGRFEHQATLLSPDMGPFGPGVPLATDWNGDGILDLVYSDFGVAGLGYPTIPGGNLLYRLGQGDGTFAAEVACPIVMSIIGDFDHDHRPDLISGTGYNGANLLLGIESCHASKIVALPDSPKQGGIAVADLNGDGNLDFAADNDKNILVRAGDGKGGFAQSLSLSAYTAGPWPIGVLLTGDLNRDGKLDIVYARDSKRGVFLNTCP